MNLNSDSDNIGNRPWACIVDGKYLVIFALYFTFFSHLVSLEINPNQILMSKKAYTSRDALFLTPNSYIHSNSSTLNIFIKETKMAVSIILHKGVYDKI